MRTFSFPTAALAVGLAVCIGAPVTGAQTAFVLDDPVLVADGRRVAVEGAPLRQDRFESLVLTVPGVGRYTVADTPFEGARRAGDFEGEHLVFAADGVSIRLRSRAPILGSSRRPAYVRSAPSGSRVGPARVHLGSQNVAVASRQAPRSARPAAPRGPARRETREAPQPLRAEVARLRAELARLAAEREDATRQRDGARRTLQADLERVTRERDALRAERDRALNERRAFAEALQEVSRETEAARERAIRERTGREQAEAIRLGAELDRLRREVVARDEAITLLSAESDDRSEQIAQLHAEVRRLSVALADTREERDVAVQARDAAIAERDAAVQERDQTAQARDAAVRERDAAVRERAAAIAQLEILPQPDDAEALRLRAEVERLSAELEETRAERDRLAALTTVQTPALDAQEGEMDALLAELESVRAMLEDTTLELEASEAARLALLAEAAERGSETPGPADAAAQAERAALIQERDALRGAVDALAEEIEALAAEVVRLRGQGSTPPPPPSAPQGGEESSVALPGFDFERLQNPDEIRSRLSSADLPQAIVGEVLVLFQTDDTGEVIRTAVPRPFGSGLDMHAEQLVRQMRFHPATVDGQPTGLRSQVVVRFGGDT